MNTQIIDAGRDASGGYKVDVSRGENVDRVTDEEAATYDALKTEFEKLEADHADADELPDEVDARLGEIETAMETLQNRPVRFEEDELAIAGAFVSIDSSGRLRVERGYVRPEDEPALPYDDQPDAGTADDTDQVSLSEFALRWFH